MDICRDIIRIPAKAQLQSERGRFSIAVCKVAPQIDDQCKYTDRTLQLDLVHTLSGAKTGFAHCMANMEAIANAVILHKTFYIQGE
jgi:hypothetical protein